MKSAHDTLDAIIGHEKQQDVLVLNFAYEIDRLTEALAHDAETLAKRLASFAANVRTGSEPGTPPTAGSLVADIAAASARITQMQQTLSGTLYVTHGPDVLRAFRAAMHAA